MISAVFVEDGLIRNGAFHAAGWDRLNWRFSRLVDREFSQPKRRDEMVGIAERSGQGAVVKFLETTGPARQQARK